MLTARFYLVPKMMTNNTIDCEDENQFTGLLAQTRNIALYGDLNLKKRIDLEKANLRCCIVDAVKA